MRASVAAVAGSTRTASATVTMAVTAGVVVAALYNICAAAFVSQVVAVAKGGKSRGREEDDVHNGKRPAGLEHGAWLVRLPAPVGDGDVIRSKPYGA